MDEWQVVERRQESDVGQMAQSSLDYLLDIRVEVDRKDDLQVGSLVGDLSEGTADLFEG